MIISEMKNIINAIKDEIQAKYGLDWLDYTLNYSQSKTGYFRCNIYASKNSEIKTDYVYIRIDTNEDMVKKSFETVVNHIVVVGWGK
jgi:hypothetical protein